MHPITTWLFSLMVTLAPPERLAALPQLPGYEETADEKRVRYAAIAEDLRVVVEESKKRPFGGQSGKHRTAALALAIAFMESGFAKDVDIGPCYRGPGHKLRCDTGLSACMMQLRIGAGTTDSGATQADLFADRKRCLSDGIAQITKSIRACKHLPDRALWLSAYASGSCNLGHKESRARWAKYERVFGELPRPPWSIAEPASEASPPRTRVGLLDLPMGWPVETDQGRIAVTSWTNSTTIPAGRPGRTPAHQSGRP